MFPSTTFLDLSEIKVTLRSKNILNRLCLVKDSHMRYPFQPDRDTSDLTRDPTDPILDTGFLDVPHAQGTSRG